MRFYNRENELQLLRDNEKLSRNAAMFTVLMGRRRVGKTSLVTKAFEGTEYAYLFVSKDNEALLCRKFQDTLKEQIGLEIYGTPARFREIFEVVMRESQNRHFTLVLDEFQNLYKINPAIFGEIQDIWDRYHTQSKLNLVVLGSIQSLMKRIFEEQSEPLYGRPTSKFILKSFSVSVLKQILLDHNPDYKPEDLLCLYMITGGVAKYVELLMDVRCVTKEQMLDYVCRQDSYFITEGRDLLHNEFNGEFSTYFSILQLIAAGKNRRSEIDGTLLKDMGTHLQNLERNFEIIMRLQPLLARSGGKTSAYEIKDNFLRFWFRFIYPYQSLVERNLFSMLKDNISKHYEQFSGRTLERYYQDKMMESQQFTQIGNWWDRKGEQEIDLIAINEFDYSGLIAEIKRNPQKIDLHRLQEKANYLPQAQFAKYQFRFEALSLEDM